MAWAEGVAFPQAIYLNSIHIDVTAVFPAAVDYD